MQSRRTAAAALLLTAAAWGATFTLIKDVLASIAPEPFVCLRFLLAGVALLAFAAARRTLARALLGPGLALGVLLFAGYELQTRGLLTVSPSRSAFLTGLYVVMVPFVDALVFRVRVDRRAWAGSLLAVIGMGTILGAGGGRPGLGDWMTIGCAVTFAFHVVLSARWSTRHAATGLAAVQVLVCGLIAAPFALAAPRPVASGAVVGAIVFTAMVTTALAFIVLMWGQSKVSATEAAVILSFEPVAAALTSILWDHEPLSRSFVAGAVLILAAMVLAQWRPAAARPVDDPVV